MKDKSSRSNYFCSRVSLEGLLIFVFVDDVKINATVDVVVFQVSYIYALAVFEDYLYATHSDPSSGSSSVELMQIHRFNITAERRVVASLGKTRTLRVYHKLTQPRGKGHFLYSLACASMCRNHPHLESHKVEFVLVQRWDAPLPCNDFCHF